MTDLATVPTCDLLDEIEIRCKDRPCYSREAGLIPIAANPAGNQPNTRNTNEGTSRDHRIVLFAELLLAILVLATGIAVIAGAV